MHRGALHAPQCHRMKIDARTETETERKAGVEGGHVCHAVNDFLLFLCNTGHSWLARASHNTCTARCAALCAAL